MIMFGTVSVSFCSYLLLYMKLLTQIVVKLISAENNHPLVVAVDVVKYMYTRFFFKIRNRFIRK